MSKIGVETLQDAVKAVLTHAQHKDNKKKFTETIELQVVLKNYDKNKDKRFAGSLVVPSIPRPNLRVCVIGNQEHMDAAKKEGLPFMSADDLKKLNKNNKKVKKLAHSYDAFLASASLIRTIPRILGPGLNKAGKFPSPINANDGVKAKVDEIKGMVKFQLKSKNNALNMGVAIGNVTMSQEDVIVNINLAVNFMVGLLPKNWQQVKKLYVKSTMGPVQQIYGF